MVSDSVIIALSPLSVKSQLIDKDFGFFKILIQISEIGVRPEDNVTMITYKIIVIYTFSAMVFVLYLLYYLL